MAATRSRASESLSGARQARHAPASNSTISLSSDAEGVVADVAHQQRHALALALLLAVLLQVLALGGELLRNRAHRARRHGGQDVRILNESAALACPCRWPS